MSRWLAKLKLGSNHVTDLLWKARDYKSKARKRAAYWVRGTRVHGIYTKGIFRGRLVEDLKTKIGWHVGTAAAFCGLYAAGTNKQVQQMAEELKNKKEELINKQKTIDHQQNTINRLSRQQDEALESNKRCEISLAKTIEVMQKIRLKDDKGDSK